MVSPVIPYYPSGGSIGGAVLSPSQFEAGVSTAGSGCIAVTTHADASTKGSWVEIIAALDFTTTSLMIILGGTSVAVQDFLVDIGTGGAGSESVLIANILVAQGANGTYGSFTCPMQVASGTRLSARAQSNSGNDSTQVAIIAISSGTTGIPALTSSVTYGADAVTTGGTGVDPGAVLNTKGAYAEVEDVTTAAMRYLVVCMGMQINGFMDSNSWLLDIATGAAASEVVLVPNLPFSCGVNSDHIVPAYVGFWCSIATAQRLACRAQCSITTADDRLFDVVLIGFN